MAGTPPQEAVRGVVASVLAGAQGFAVHCPLAPLGVASDPVLVHRPAASLPTSSPRSVALPQLRFTSFRMASSRLDLHQQDDAHKWFLSQVAAGKSVRAQHIAERFGVARPTAKRDVRALVDKGFIEFVGPRKTGRYVRGKIDIPAPHEPAPSWHSVGTKLAYSSSPPSRGRSGN